MEERIGFLMPEQEKLLAQALDAFLRFKNGAMEKVDGPVALIVIRGVDNRFGERISPAWKTPLIPIIDAALSGKEETVRQLTTDLMNRKIDIPGVDEEIELMMFDGFTRFAAAAVAWYAEKRKVA